MCLNLCNTLRTPRAREGHFRREAWDLHRRLPLFCLLGSRSRKRRKQQSATKIFIAVVSEFCINQLCHVMPPPLSNSSEHPQHVTAYICLQFWPPKLTGLSLPSGALAGDRLRQLHPKLLQLWTEFHLGMFAQWCTCIPHVKVLPLWNLNRTPLPNKVWPWPMAE